jgi:RNA polymerase sigma factor (sigma-70 family)
MAAEMLMDLSDAELVKKAISARDESAFEAIVRRHGQMVYRVCWRVLQSDHDAEDAFQATFLVLPQKILSVRKRASLACWLHGVAHRVALKAKAQATMRRRHEQEALVPETTPPDDLGWAELRALLDSQLSALPETWRQPLILCYLEGRTQDEAAGQLKWSKSTLRRRLDGAREALAKRLSRRGVVWSTAFVGVLVTDCTALAVPPALLTFAGGEVLGADWNP